ncbi:subtype B tannase [Pigmentiphaga sp.]|uniref:subtype B tannase n=1 Tax=Pigmentiphaga sp. TaxID=1977564 RepID=UPI0025FE6664|nr:subtype B tannase [Pigmentiphaga sp.]
MFPRTLISTCVLLALAACGGSDGSSTGTDTTTPPPPAAAGPGVFDGSLAFDKAGYTTITVTVDGVSTPVRWYREVCYVGKPMKLAPTQSAGAVDNQDCGYQNMNIFVREADAARQDNPIFFNVNNSGWLASYQGGKGGWDPATPVTRTNYSGADIVNGGAYVSTGDTDKIGAALSRGFVYINVASRSRGAVAPDGVYADGVYQGKAPAAIVDAKAAVRYLRLNDALMSGDASRIVVNGTSGGGAQSTQLGATGNSADYFPYLQAIGAAGIDKDGKSSIGDDVFAIVAYCPIQDMGSADLAYEWMFNVLDTRALVAADQLAGKIVDAGGTKLIRASNPDPAGSVELMHAFKTYQAGLGLKNDDGSALTTDNMLAAIQAEIKQAATRQVKAGKPFVAYGAYGDAAGNGVGGGSGTLHYLNDFIGVDAGGEVTFFDMTKYMKFVATQARLKSVPAFDRSGQSGTAAGAVTTDGAGTVNNAGGESNLFGNAIQVYSNFTEYGWNHNDGANGTDRQDGVGLASTGYSWAANPQRAFLLNQYKMINALPYVGKTDGITPHWRIRVGARDRDTSFTVAYNLSRALKADPKVKDIDYALQWDQGHAGNYDVQEAMAWVDRVLAAASTVR